MALFRQRIVEVPPALEGKILNLTKVTPKYILQHTEPANVWSEGLRNLREVGNIKFVAPIPPYKMG